MNWLWLRIDAMLTALAVPELLAQMREEIRQLRAEQDAAGVVRQLLMRELREKADCAYPNPWRSESTPRCGTCWTCLREAAAAAPARQPAAPVIESATLLTRRVTLPQQESDHE